MIVNMYTIAFPEDTVRIEKHSFDEDRKEDIDDLQSYLDEEDEYDWYLAAQKWMYEESGLEWSQRFVKNVQLNEQEYNELKSCLLT